MAIQPNAILVTIIVGATIEMYFKSLQKLLFVIDQSLVRGKIVSEIIKVRTINAVVVA
jgi:hypothetical protein